MISLFVDLLVFHLAIVICSYPSFSVVVPLACGYLKRQMQLFQSPLVTRRADRGLKLKGPDETLLQSHRALIETLQLHQRAQKRQFHPWALQDQSRRGMGALPM